MINVGSDGTPARSTNEALIVRLQSFVQAALTEVLPLGSDYAILDFPNHANIGDSAIYVGEVLALREHLRRDPVLVTEAWDFELERIARLDERVLLLLHGGGNFGDLYHRHQHFRLAVLERFPHRKIVLLPQSLHFADRAQIGRTAQVIAAHADFTMMVRDKPSLEFARAHFRCQVMLVPDMAFMIGPIPPADPPTDRVVCLLRDDKESAVAERAPLQSLPTPHAIVDWPHEPRARSLVEHVPRSLRRLLPGSLQGRRPETPSAFEELARRRLARGVRLLSRGEVVITDRLHGHILSLLLARPHVVLDNSYGKVSGFADAWTTGGDFSRARTIEEAVHLATAMLKTGPHFGEPILKQGKEPGYQVIERG